jgi:hypothetical protein
MERFILSNAEAVGISLSDFDLPIDINELNFFINASFFIQSKNAITKN